MTRFPLKTKLQKAELNSDSAHFICGLKKETTTPKKPVKKKNNNGRNEQYLPNKIGHSLLVLVRRRINF